MRVILALLASASLLAATSAYAECSNTITTKAASGYIYKDFGDEASTEPVGSAELTRTCGKWSYDLWASAGPGGGLADEVDASIFYDTRTGPLKVQVSAQYYAVNLHHSLLDPHDDLVEFYADVSVPLTRGRLTVAPMTRVIEAVGFGEIPTQTLLQGGGRASYRVTDRITLGTDVRISFNQTKHYGVLRYVANVSDQFTDHTSLMLQFESTDRTRSVISVAVTHRF